ncbi:pyridoxamine 5'-phosphate oxidase family protein [Nocardioides eburneiflavus]|uniref:Pyridoxamine 5'-phosphate oxidase family protein n=1 Tax=Nocardioides eburneiflavus TaxID=2518372 RepID=A0A4Z1CIN1_9ACTN|nr:pyridoxamine 5'-phosphate oxidase family protein [Nocardioides eburneiflavus]TGN63183.1 pyridoxamine 5'-phosphate oxidase family protein [Nocardioides eburneiflavus]
MTTDEIAAASLAEVSWVAAGLPRICGVVPLARGDVPVLAFTYADEDLARAVAGAPVVTLSLTEPRSTGTAFRPLVLVGRPRLVEDPSGDLFATDLLPQELRRYPPSRLLADSPLLQREHWWYLARLLVEIDVDAVMPVVAREDPARDHLLVVAGTDGPIVQVARLSDGDPCRVALRSHGTPPPGPAVLFGQDASFPDLEQWAQWSYRGRWDGAALQVDQAPDRVGLGRPPGLLQRWRRQRDLERRCVAAIPRSVR